MNDKICIFAFKLGELIGHISHGRDELVKEFGNSIIELDEALRKMAEKFYEREL